MRSSIGLHLYLTAATILAVSAWDCQCGTYCPNATATYLAPVKCPVGYYCPEGGYLQQTFPKACTAGFQCPKAGLCVPESCPCGYYCPKGSSAPQPCAAGTYSTRNSSKCIVCHSSDLCPYSKMCQPLASSLGTTTTVCPCPSTLPPGYVCPNIPLIGTGCSPICNQPAKCGSGVLSKMPGTTTSGFGQHLKVSTTPTSYLCGYYVPANLTQSPSNQKPCRAGYYCPVGPKPLTPIVPVRCPPGYFCGVGTCTPSPCQCGHKCPAGSSAPIASQPPYYIPNKLAINQTLCPVGFMCSVPGLCAPIPCPLGTYVSCAGKKSCDPCPKGRYCPLVTSSLLCPAGSFCAGGASAPTMCPAGHFCPLGASAALSCPARTTSPPGAKSKSQCT